jgi:hypothetical protein
MSASTMALVNSSARGAAQHLPQRHHEGGEQAGQRAVPEPPQAGTQRADPQRDPWDHHESRTVVDVTQALFEQHRQYAERQHRQHQPDQHFHRLAGHARARHSSSGASRCWAAAEDHTATG